MKKFTKFTRDLQENRPDYKKIAIAIIACLLGIGILVGVLIYFSPTQKASRLFEKQITASNGEIPVRKLTNNHITIPYTRDIGKAITEEPAWVTEGLAAAKAGETSEMALFAARFKAESFYVEKRYDELDHHNGKDFNRRNEWKMMVYTIGNAYFNNADKYTEQELETIKGTLVWLLQ